MMGVYLEIDDEQTPLASSRGWADVCDWIDALDADEFGAVVHLREYGWVEPAGQLLAELRSAVEFHAPDDDTVSDTLAGFVAALEGIDESAPVIVSDGMGPDTGEDDDDLVPLTLAEWHEQDHPRGQPGNAGQFGPGGGGGETDAEPKSEPAKPAPSGDDAVAATADKWLAGADHLSAELRAAYHGHLTHALAGMPEPARKMATDAIDKGGAKFYSDVASLTQAASAITGRREHGVHGFVAPRAGGAVELHLDSGSETDPKAQYAARGTYTHELWHAVDADSFYTDKPKWQSAYKKDILKGRSLLSRYAMESPSEGFAELGRVLQEKGPEYVKANWPNCYKFLEAEKLL